MTTLHPFPWRHVGRGQVQDANGLPVLWVCHDQAFGWTADCENAAELAGRAPELLASAERLVKLLAAVANTPAAVHLPPILWTLSGSLAGHVALCGGDISPQGGAT